MVRSVIKKVTDSYEHFLLAPDEFSAFPSVKKMDEEISSLLRTAVVLNKNSKHAEVKLRMNSDTMTLFLLL